MNTKPTFKSLDPVQVGPFNEYDQKRNRWRAERGIKHDPVAPSTFNAPDHVSPAAVAAIFKAFTQSKTSRDGWRSYKREGRFDPRRAAGASRLEQDVFQRKTGRSTTRVKCAVLIDASGSMHWSNTARIPNPMKRDGLKKSLLKVNASTAAAVFGATICRALGRIPTVDLDVYQHSHGPNLIMKWRWHRGTPTSVFNESVFGIGGGGNADGHALFAVIEKMRREIKRGEKGVVMVVSDGLPADYASDGDSDPGQALIDAVAHGRKHGIEVIGVSIDNTDQSVYYGPGFIAFDGNWGSLGTELAKHIGKALARQ